jgi:pilus assembly protein CpaE
MSRERIALKVAPEASDLDPSRGIVLNGATVPAIVTRRADTTVELGDGESFVIGGLVSRNTVSNVSKVPFLGDLPIIGSFFKNLNFHQEDRELMIVVTPHLVKPLAKDSRSGRRVPGRPHQRQPQCLGPLHAGRVRGPEPARVLEIGGPTMERNTSVDHFLLNTTREDVRHWLGHALGAVGTLVAEADSQDSFVEKIGTLRPGLVFLDFTQSRAIDSARLAEQIARLFPQLPLVAVGNAGEPEAMLAALRAGVRDFIDLAARPTMRRRGPPVDGAARAGARSRQRGATARSSRCSARVRAWASPAWP